MNTRPISFSAAMVRAILDGRKTQTRRVMKPQPELKRFSGINIEGFDLSRCDGWFWEKGDNCESWSEDFENPTSPLWLCPYGRPGDLLWVKEEYTIDSYDSAERTVSGHYPVDDASFFDVRLTDAEWEKFTARKHRISWQPGMFLYRSLSRITLKLADVQVQRVQEISEGDARAEGIVGVTFRPDDGFPLCEGYMVHPDDGRTPLDSTPINTFHKLWDSINAKRGFGWEVNPWVWALTFERADTFRTE